MKRNRNNSWSERDELLYHCAELFYVEGLSKREVASRVHVSPTHVKRLLDEAVKKGIVQLEVKLAGRFRKLETAIKKRFSLSFVRVVEAHSDYDIVKTNLGQAAVDLLETYIQRRSRVKLGIGGGGTLLRMVELLEQRPRQVDIYPLSFFGRGPLVEFISSTFLATYLVIKSLPLATGHIVAIPPLPSRRELAVGFATWLLEEFPEISQVYNGVKTMDLGFVGLGAAIPSRDIFAEFSKLGYTFEYMQEHGAVGGINYNYFDKNGEQIGKGIMTLSVEELRELASDASKTIVLVAGGVHKREAIAVAVETRMVNGLITDEDVAGHLIASTTD
jgi:deoxyribonucleoside regulator